MTNFEVSKVKIEFVQGEVEVALTNIETKKSGHHVSDIGKIEFVQPDSLMDSDRKENPDGQM
jgi:hypothetical protein